MKRKTSTVSTLKFQEQPSFYLNEITPTPLSYIARNSTTAIRGISEFFLIIRLLGLNSKISKDLTELTGSVVLSLCFLSTQSIIQIVYLKSRGVCSFSLLRGMSIFTSINTPKHSTNDHSSTCALPRSELSKV